MLLLAKMFSMELNYVAGKYFDEDTKMDSRSFLNHMLTVVTSQLAQILAGRSEVSVLLFMLSI